MSISSVLKSLRTRTICFLTKIDLLLLRPLFKQEDERLRISLKKYGFSIVLINHPSVFFAHHDGGGRYKAAIGLESFVRFLRYALAHRYMNRGRATRMLLAMGVPAYYAKCPTCALREFDNNFGLYHVPENKNEMAKRIVVYSVITGDYDDVQAPLYKSDKCDYLLFTNNEMIKDVDGWQIVYVDEPISDLLLSRKIKMLPHKYLPKEYELSIYVDGKVMLYGDIKEMAQYLNEEVSFAVTKHDARDSVLAEIEACYGYGILNEERHDKAIARYNQYIKEGFKDDLGLAECGLLVRRHTDEKLQEVMEMWYAEFINACGRDQFELMPVINRLKFTGYRLLDGNMYLNQYCSVDGHKKKK